MLIAISANGRNEDSLVGRIKHLAANRRNNQEYTPAALRELRRKGVDVRLHGFMRKRFEAGFVRELTGNDEIRMDVRVGVERFRNWFGGRRARPRAAKGGDASAGKAGAAQR